jgi:serine protease Do
LACKSKAPPAPAANATATEAAAGDLPVNFVALVKRLDPTVVTIKTSALLRGAGGGLYPDLEPEPEEAQIALGSGFIVDPAGFIVTNTHVVAGGTDILVILSDGNEVPARVVGRDEDIDVALLKIEAKGLSAVTLGDSDALQVGEWILAIGNPFGLSHTVTAGIVSAVGRTTREVPVGKQSLYASFIQTDASINPGNSGGPIVNTNGEVVGVAIAVDRRGGGIGFAVPINMVKELLPALATEGRPVRSFLGVFLSPMSADLAEATGLPGPMGVFVAGVVEGSPAARAGLAKGDVILEFDGHAVDAKTLPWRAAVVGPGKTVKAKVWRGGAPKVFEVKMAKLPE